MTDRLTVPQLTVMLALAELPEGEWATARAGGFNGNAAGTLWWGWASARHGKLVCTKPHAVPSQYALTPAGRAFVARLNAEVAA